ncbi:MAG: hypothetical protein IT365_16220 [Candidatus Hydrogenedentes bacterium]|nr:hypothetical protein [Candidatus Hydrogenedentota bacterium]
MTTQLKDLTRLTFDGPKYDDHGLEIDDLSELQAYKKLLVETAKEVWKRNNLDRTRIQRGWLDSITIKFYGIEAGSASVALKREVEYPDDQMRIESPDEFDEAAEILQDCIVAAGTDSPLPEAMPKNVIPLFENFGKSLGGENRIRVRAHRREQEATYTQEVQKRLTNWLERTYPDQVDQIGEVRATDLDGGRFTLRLRDGSKVEGRFTPEQEAIVTDALKEHAKRRLRVIGSGEFLSGTAKLKRITEVFDISIVPLEDAGYDDSAPPIWDIVCAIGSEVPDKAWENVPRDLAKNLDHYLYGREKEREE